MNEVFTIKKILLTILVLSILVLSACTKPPADVPSAVVEDKDSMEDNSMEDNAMDDSMEEGAMEDEAMDNSVELPPVPPSPEVRIDQELSSFEFEGYGVGKSHTGTFEEMEGFVLVEGGMITSARGTIQASSVKSDSGGLDKHLLNADFFNAEVYPTMSFKSDSISETEMVGELTFLGVTKSITIPVTHEDGSLSADFLLETTQFGMSYAGVEPEVRIAFTLVPSQ